MKSYFTRKRPRGPENSALLLWKRLVCLLLPSISVAFLPQQRVASTRLHPFKTTRPTRLFQSSYNNNSNNTKKKRGNLQSPKQPQKQQPRKQAPPPPPDPNDPRAFRRNRRILRDLNEANFKRAKQAVQKRKRDEAQAAAAFDLPEQPLVRTIGGGTAMMFAMAARMFEQQLNEESQLLQQQQQQQQEQKQQQQQQANGGNTLGTSALPRWRPAAGIANVNPAFRTSSPNMNNQGYAGVIWRNVRKSNKPSLWRYALRTYDRMTQQQDIIGGDEGSNRSIHKKANRNGVAAADGTGVNADLVVQPTNIHHEGALLATAKLGSWERALEIYRRVQDDEASLRKRNVSRLSVQVTEHMVGSVVRACVKGAKRKYDAHGNRISVQDRRRPLDAARTILQELESAHGIPLDAKHVNPLAAGYQSLGLRQDAVALVDSLLGDRIIGPEPEVGQETLNINNLGTKDKASYALQVTAAVRDADWGTAVENLTIMTEAGLYPVDRHLNVWTEVSERKTKHRATRSYKKKRESWVLPAVAKN